MDIQQPPRKIRRAPRLKSHHHPILGMILFIIGFITLLLIHLIIGAIIATIGIAIGWTRWKCGHCGNKVQKSTNICPHCSAHLKSMPRK